MMKFSSLCVMVTALASAGAAADQLVVKLSDLQHPPAVSAEGKNISTRQLKVATSAVRAMSVAAGAKVKIVRALGNGRVLIESAGDSEDLAKALIQSGVAVSAEPNALIRQINVASAGAANDPLLPTQRHMLSATAIIDGLANAAGSDLLAARTESEQLRQRRIRVGIVDSGALQHEDVGFADGWDFVAPRGADYADRGQSTDALGQVTYHPECKSGHGLSVAGIIGAKTDNGAGIGGIADVDLVMARAMQADCAMGAYGSLADIADAITWLSGGSVPDVPVIAAPVSVINASVGGESICPDFLQEAIDGAVARGVPVVVSAGNAGIDALNFSPANCDNVIVVGGIDANGGKLAYSNFGERVDVSAWGEAVPAPGMNGATDYAPFSGTSASAPIVTGLIALIQQARDISPEAIEELLKSTARPFAANKHQEIAAIACTDDTQGQCLGRGIVDGVNALSGYAPNPEPLRAAAIVSLYGNSVQHGCATRSFLSELNKKIQICSGADLIIDGDSVGGTYELWAGAEASSRRRVATTAAAGSTRIYDLPGKGESYSVRHCTISGCGEFVSVSDSEYNPPAACN